MKSLIIILSSFFILLAQDFNQFFWNDDIEEIKISELNKLIKQDTSNTQYPSLTYKSSIFNYPSTLTYFFENNKLISTIHIINPSKNSSLNDYNSIILQLDKMLTINYGEFKENLIDFHNKNNFTRMWKTKTTIIELNFTNYLKTPVNSTIKIQFTDINHHVDGL